MNKRTLLVLIAVVGGAAFFASSGQVNTPADAHSPHAGLQFSIGLDVDGDSVDDCNTSGGPTVCSVESSAAPKLHLYLDNLGDIAAYSGAEFQVAFSGMTWKGTGSTTAPNCSGPGLASGNLHWNCLIFFGSQSYTGLIGTAHMNYDCTGPASADILYGPGETFLVDEFTANHSEAGPDSLTLTCGSPPDVLGELGTRDNAVLIRPGSMVRWVCDPGNPTTVTDVRFAYDWGTEDVSGVGAVTVVQSPPPNILNSVACVYDGDEGTPLAVEWPQLIDPSGTVTDIPSGLPIPEASVTLQVESPPDSGIYVDVPVESDADPPDPGPYGIKEPDLNPEITGIDGKYSWDVAPGRYRVVVSKATCTTVISPPVDIPPPVTDLDVGITCTDTDSDGIPDVLEDLYGVSDPAGDDDGDGLMNQEELNLGTDPLVSDNVDLDGDGCVNLKKIAPGSYRGELTGSKYTGGQRDNANPWDYFDPDKAAGSVGLQRIGDILVVLNQYYDDFGEPAYLASTDRAPQPVGVNAWNLGPPDGLQRIQDIVHALNQYYNDCA